MKLSKLQPSRKLELPVIPLRELVVFPHTVVTFFVGHQASLRALNEAISRGHDIFLAFQINSNDKPTIKDLHPIGTIARVVQVMKLPDGKLRILVEGRERVFVKSTRIKKDILWGRYVALTINEQDDIKPAMNLVKDNFLDYSRFLKKKIPREAISTIVKTNNPEKIIGLVCTTIKASTDRLIPFLLETDNRQRLEELAILLQMETETLSLKDDISGRVKKRMERTQREYFLNEQLKEIHRELGSEDTDFAGIRELENKIAQLEMSPEARNKACTEIKRLSRLQPMSPESGVLRTYLEWLLDLPWGIRTSDNHDISEVASQLDSDHFGLEKPKERILDFVAVQQLQPEARSPILCFAGPPGTGKTSLGRSVANALGRKFVRISLGGVRDEAEIRGHRKTYVGALPGKIIQALKRAGTVNPVFLLDEVDKMSNDFRGDPSSALLEVLDPEQNNTFSDHYIEVPFDLSEVMFITTANSVEEIPHPLRDRMEIIRTPGYTMMEKKSIARQFIIPKQIEENGLSSAHIEIPEDSLDLLIRGYTLEAGVRNMERCISQIMRKTARKFLHDEQTRPGRWIVNSAAFHLYQTYWAVNQRPENYKHLITAFDHKILASTIKEYLGNERLEDDLGTEGRPGLATGLYYDGGGGGVLPVEALIFEGEGKLLLTGQLGDVMKESAQIALSYLCANKHLFGLKEDFNKNKDIHIHVPQGAIPVDGPSAGIALTSALLSAALQIPLKSGIVMTGEVTLTDRILPVGGIKEKVLAARRRGFSIIIIPKDNKRDIEKLPPEVNGEINYLFHSSLSEAIRELFPEGVFTFSP